MLNEVQSLLPERARFAARVSDLEDIEELVRVYRSSVLRHAWWLLKDRDLAETVTQDCFMRAFNSRALYRGQCSVRTWLLAITTNLVRDRTPNPRLSILETGAGFGRRRVRHGKPGSLPAANRRGRDAYARKFASGLGDGGRATGEAKNCIHTSFC